MVPVILALGSNMGNKEENLKKAVDLLSGIISDVKTSSLYLTRPVGETNQDIFFNMVLKGYTNLPPFELLKKCQQIEKKIGRVYRYHWGPREIDIDVIFYGDKVITTENLKVPHPLMQERDFVVIPLLEIDTKYLHPVLKAKAKDLIGWIREISILGRKDF